MNRPRTHFLCIYCNTLVAFRSRDQHHCPGLDALRIIMSMSSSTPHLVRELAEQAAGPPQLKFQYDFFNTPAGN